MAIIKNPEDLSNATNYVATIAFFCCISCVTLMLKFGGFKASLNILNGKKNRDTINLQSGLCMNGAYRTNRDEFFGSGGLPDPPRKLTPSMVSLPSCDENLHAVRPTKSMSDLSKPNLAPQLRQTTPNAFADPRGGDTNQIPRNSRQNRNNQEKEQKRLEKQRLAEQKEREKAAAKEQAKQEKIREKVKKEALAKAKKDKRKTPAPQPERANPLVQPSVLQPERRNLVTQAHVPYSTNTLESSISRSSGPPPYSGMSQPGKEQNENVTTGNVTFGKPIDTSSWDRISEHRQQLSRTTNGETKHNKKTIMDLNYNLGIVIKEERDKSVV